MNKVQSKHYSLLLQDDADPNEDILSIHNEKIRMSNDNDDEDDDDDDDDGFKSMIGEDEEQDVEDDEDVDVEEEGDGSDEEIFSSNQHRSLSNESARLSGQPNFGRKNDYHLLSSNEGDHKPIAMGFEAPLSTVWTPTPMSPVRRACFLASIMFGVLVVAMFLWALPCDVQPCENELKLQPREWFSEIDYIGINYTQLLEKINGDLSIFIGFYKIDKISDTSANKSSTLVSPKLELTPSQCGLLLLTESSGKERWRINLDECPLHINCALMDSTGDGLQDCLILGHSSMALMFEPIYGSIFWHVHVHGKEHSALQLDQFHFDLPIALQDLDADGFAELLFPVLRMAATSDNTSGGNTEKSYLVLVSGRTGAIIGKPFSIMNCQKIIEIFREDVSIGYSCSMENRSELTGKIPLANLLNEIGKSYDEDQHRNDTLEVQNVKQSPEVNDAICQIKYVNKGKCPYCKTKIELGLSLDNPVYEDYEYSTVVSWKILSYGNICKGALMKVWKWDATSLQEAFLESSPMEEDTKELMTTNPFGVNKEEFDFKLGDPPVDDNYGSVYDNQDIDSSFVPFNQNYQAKTDIYNTLESSSVGKALLSKGRRDTAEEALLYSTHNTFKGNNIPLIDTLKVPQQQPNYKTKKFYEHPIIHKHNGKQTSNNHDDSVKLPDASASSTKTTTTAATTTITTSTVQSHSEPSHLQVTGVSAPNGLRLQKLEEILVLFVFNGSDWVSRELGSMMVYQLCQKRCMPSHRSQKDSVLIDSSSLQNQEWNLYATSSSFSSIREEATNETVTWTLESYVRKLITQVGN